MPRDEWLVEFAEPDDDAPVLAPMPASDPVACWIGRAVWAGIVIGGFTLGAVAVLIVRRILS